MPTDHATQPKQTRAMRLIFEYDGDQVRLVSQQPVDMAITGVDMAQAQHPGYHVDTRDAAGRTLARVPARTAFSGSAEVFPEQPGEPISRVDVARPQGAFSVVVPAPEDADHVSLVHLAPAAPDAAPPGSGLARAAAAAPTAIDIAKFPLHLGR